MDAWFKPIIGLAAVVSLVVGGLSYFATSDDLVAIAGQVQQNSDQITYQSLIRTREWLLTQTNKYPTDIELKRRLEDTDRRIKLYEQKLFK